jgi:hypothetical protein
MSEFLLQKVQAQIKKNVQEALPVFPLKFAPKLVQCSDPC